MTNLQMNADGTITSTSATSTIGFNEEFFTLLEQYGYTRVSFTIATTANTSTYYGTRIRSNNRTITGTQNISGATNYTAQYRSSRNGTYIDDDNAEWKLSNVTFS